MTSSYIKRIVLCDLTHIMSIVDPITIGDETQWIDSRSSLEKEFIKLIRMNHLMIIILNF